MPETCCWGDCPEPATRRDDGTYACTTHMRVHVASNGSWLEDETHHHLPKGRG